MSFVILPQPQGYMRVVSCNDKKAGAYLAFEWLVAKLRSPDLYSTATGRIVGGVEPFASLLAAVSSGDEFWNESMVQLAPLGFLPFWGGQHLALRGQ